MTKKILIVGTSHSVQMCSDTEDGKLHYPHRWHDYLQTEYGYEVENFSFGGVTIYQQFLALYHYLKDTDKTWDLILIEGRALDLPMTMPSVDEKVYYCDVPSELYYVNVNKSSIGKHIPVQRYGSLTEQKNRVPDSYIPYYVDYTESIVHFIDHISINRAMCDIAARYAKMVKFFCMWEIPTFSDDPKLRQDARMGYELGKDIMGKYLLGDNYQSIPLPELRSNNNYKCKCHHFNPEGNKIVWGVIKELLSKDFLTNS